MSSKWGEKLQGKLSALTEASSKESVQTLAMWIWFNRKHKDAFIATIREVLELGDSSRNSVVLSVIHEVFLLNLKQADKWETAVDLRLSLGESVVLPFAGSAFPASKIQASLALWDTHNVFSGPTLIHQIRDKLQSASTPSKTANAPQLDTKSADASGIDQPNPQSEATARAPSEPTTEPATATTPESATTEKQQLPLKVSTPETDSMPESATKKPRISRSGSIPPGTPRDTVPAYNFEATGIEAAPIDAKDLVDPCRNIATLQIARDLQSEAAVHLSGLLQNLPQAVRAFIAERAEQDDDDATAAAVALELPESKAREYCALVSDTLLDLDLTEQLANVQAYRDLVTRQRAARQQLLNALIASRCEFRADEAAAAYYAVDDSALKHRAQLLVDAMDLEGLEVQPVTMAAAAQSSDELPPLSWYNPEPRDTA
jgi:hypothetical protein